ncbi:MAG: 4-hydroxybenzoate 3-monooxygenase [Chloroflexi bacterium]|nr:4-hydroxybenzoate 3-monooxygenase [Chloroflexota bacterium]
MRTQVGIIGAGPAGLVLSHLLALEGIESVVLESRSRQYVERRMRAGLLEQGTVDLLCEAGVGDRLRREALVHHGIELMINGTRHRIPLTELTGKSVFIYGQHEVVKDLIEARLNAHGQILFESEAVDINGLDSDLPTIRFRGNEAIEELRADFVVGCDGFHGVSRAAIPSGAVVEFQKTYPFSWLGIFAAVPPSNDELIYSYSERGFALHTMRSPQLTRLYLQCATNEVIQNWSDDRIWNELHARFPDPDWTLNEGPIVEKGITDIRSYVIEPMRYRRLFLAGDAAHIVPPTGAKGMNLAIFDARVLADAMVDWYRSGRTDLLESYSGTCLRRVWRVQHFSWWYSEMLHKLGDGEDSSFQQQLQLSQLRYITTSRAAMTSLAENYVGLGVV